MLRLLTRQANTSKHRFYSTVTDSNKLRVVFFGTDDFATTHLKALVEEKEKNDSYIDSIDLVCPPDRRTGRKLEKLTPSETKGLASSKNLEIFHTPARVKTLNDWHIPTTKPYDVGVVVSFGYFIPPHIISSLKYGAVNVHPSLLPKYRGAAPIQHAIMYGDASTGVTIQELDDREFDAGRILAQETLDLSHKPPIYSELKKTLANTGSRMLVDTLRHLVDRKKNAITQDVSLATKAPKIKKEWSELDFTDMSAWQAEQLDRAIGEQYPMRTMYQKKQKQIAVQLLELSLVESTRKEEPGTFVYDDASRSMHIVFGDGSVLACKKFKVENKGTISAHDFANGYQTKGKFGGVADEAVVKSNIRKRQKMKQYGKQ